MFCFLLLNPEIVRWRRQRYATFGGAENLLYVNPDGMKEPKRLWESARPAV
jgi:hypothetical protein